MSPQPSSPPERSRCVDNPTRSQTRSECMYIHYKVPKLYNFLIHIHASKVSVHMTPNLSIVASSLKLYLPGDPPRVPKGIPPGISWRAIATMSHGAPNAQSFYPHTLSRQSKPSDKAKCMHSLVDPPVPPQVFIFNQFNRKNRPFSNPSSWAVPKTWRSLKRKSFFNHFLSLRTSSRTERVQARMRGPEINNNSTKNKG